MVADPMDMTDEEYDRYRARQSAACVYRANGFPAFADQVEEGLEDQCSQMRIARFFIEPAPEPSPEYIGAWAELAEGDGRCSRGGVA